MIDPGQRLATLPEVEVPAALDALVFERACRELETKPPAPRVVISRAEALVYAAGLAAYGAYLLRAVHGAVQVVLRAIAG